MSEIQKRNKLKETKPLVYEKIIQNKISPIIQLQYNYDCNFKCEHCSISKVKNKNRRSLNPEHVKYIFQQADELGLARAVITGGEPLIFKDLDQVVEAINPNKFYINCDTNGYFLTKEKAVHLQSIGIDRIQLSIDSLIEKEHDSFRCKNGAYNNALKAIENSLYAKLDIFIQTVVTHTRLYSKEFIQFLEYFTNKNIGVFITFAKPVGSFEGNFNEMVSKVDFEFIKNLEKDYKVFTHLTPAYGVNEKRMCIGGRNIFSITQYGDVLICPYFYCSMGNIFEEPLKDILERMLKLKPFKKDTCLLAEDKEFVNKYLVKKLYGKDLPVNYKEVFTKEDWD